MTHEGGCICGAIRLRLTSEPMFVHNARALAPGAHCFTRSKQPWVVIPPDVPASDGHYDAEAIWPSASLQRLTSALAE